MRQLGPLQIKTGWYFVSRGDEGAHRIGYCPNHNPHSTKTEAELCYSGYLRDGLSLTAKSLNYEPCKVCGIGTRLSATVLRPNTYGFVSLCDDHLIPRIAYEELNLNEPAATIWIS